MPRQPRPWIVPSHGKFEKLEPDLWCVQADLNGWSKMRRRMFIARLGDGRLAFMNGIPLDEPSMRELEDWGAPAFLMVPTGMHRLDIAAFRARFPKIYLLTSASFHDKVARVAPVDGGWELFPRDGRVRLVELRGARGEIALRVGGTLCFPGDVFMNVPDFGGIERFLWRTLGSIGGPRITPIAKMFVVGDRKTLRDELMKLSSEPELERIVPCHGDAVRLDVRGVLRRAAASL